MIKQIKKRLAGVILVSLTCISVVIAPPARISDVVENKSVIDEQINLEQQTNKKMAKNELESVYVQELVVSSVEEEKYYDGWTTTRVNVRISPSVDATVLTTYNFNTQISYKEYNDDWVIIEYGSSIAYMAKEFISNTKCEYNEINIPSHKDFKSYMGYKTITDKESNQYKIQSQYAYTGTYGIRQVNDRYCVALGSYFGVEVGQYFDLVLENGVIIPCIMGDFKANCDTNSQNIFTESNGCCSEFIVDSDALVASAKSKGSISYTCEEWNSQVIAIRIYEKNVLN